MLPITCVCTNSKRLVARRRTSVKGKFLNLALLQASHFPIFLSNVASSAPGSFSATSAKRPLKGVPSEYAKAYPCPPSNSGPLCFSVAGLQDLQKLPSRGFPPHLLL